jgi:hypothetical protein
MEMYMKENGKMIKLMVMVSIIMQMEQNMKVSGEKISKKGQEEKSGQIKVVFKECTKMVKSMALVNLYGLMEHAMKVIGS